MALNNHSKGVDAVIDTMMLTIERVRKEYDDLPDIYRETGIFFRHLHFIFKCYFDDGDCDGLTNLISIIQYSSKIFGDKGSKELKPVLSDLVQCLRFEDLSPKVYTLLDELCKNELFWLEFRSELNSTPLNATDTPLIDALKKMTDNCRPAVSAIESVSAGFDHPDGNRIQTYNHGIEYQQAKKMPTHDTADTGTSLLPPSITEQWLLATTTEEVCSNTEGSP
jgi:hypothetical protein